MVRSLDCTVLLLLCVLAFASSNLVQFGRMIRKVTGKSEMLYYGYGCYCGLGGSREPLDATDWCCRVHDCCYEAMSKLGCKPKLEFYSYHTQKNTIICSGKTNCQKQTCECDKAAALCFRRSAFDPNLIGYPNFLCRGPVPPC